MNNGWLREIVRNCFRQQSRSTTPHSRSLRVEYLECRHTQTSNVDLLPLSTTELFGECLAPARDVARPIISSPQHIEDVRIQSMPSSASISTSPIDIQLATNVDLKPRFAGAIESVLRNSSDSRFRGFDRRESKLDSFHLLSNQQLEIQAHIKYSISAFGRTIATSTIRISGIINIGQIHPVPSVDGFRYDDYGALSIRQSNGDSDHLSRIKSALLEFALGNIAEVRRSSVLTSMPLPSSPKILSHRDGQNVNRIEKLTARIEPGQWPVVAIKPLRPGIEFPYWVQPTVENVDSNGSFELQTIYFGENDPVKTPSGTPFELVVLSAPSQTEALRFSRGMLLRDLPTWSHTSVTLFRN